jgi:hypothetical protein
MPLTHRPHDDGQGGDDEEYVERSSSFIPLVAAAVIAAAVLIFGFPSAPKKDPRDTNCRPFGEDCGATPTRPRGNRSLRTGCAFAPC